MLFENIKKLVQYGIDTGLTPECERIYTTNLLLDLFHEENYEDSNVIASVVCMVIVGGLLITNRIRAKDWTAPEKGAIV